MIVNKYKKLAYNSVIFSIANFGSKILHFLIVPYYTYCLSTTEYGVVDTITTTVTLILPVLLLAIHEATLRYTLKDDIDKHSILTNSFFILLITSVVFLFSYFFFSQIDLFRGLWWMFYFLLVSSAINSILLNYTRGNGKSGTFALGGIINTIVLLSCNVLLLSVVKLGIVGYMISMILGYTISNIYLAISIKIWNLLSPKSIDISLAKQMLKYSFPLIPVAMMWWIMNVSDRYVINLMLGVSFTGIYAVSSKIPSIITTVYQIFQQAWQLSAIEERGTNGEKKFYDNVYNFFTAVLILTSSFVILFIKPLIMFAVSPSYVDAWKYSPFLIVGAVFSSMSGLLGVNYTVVENTRGALYTTVISAGINLILNISLTPFFGMEGTALATLIGFYFLWLLRSKDTQKYMNIRQNYFQIHFEIALLLIQSIVLICELQFQYFIQFIIIVILFIINRKFIYQISSVLKNAKIKCSR